jgi:imidazole glycerol-phosphate synthase subunit HisH
MSQSWIMIDYGVGNVFSLMEALKRCGIDCTLTRDPQLIMDAKVILLPGVGAFEDAMNQLRKYGLDGLLKGKKDNQWLVGICLGMQLLYEESEEFGVHQGLGFLKGRVIKFEDTTLKIPHMGWNVLNQNQEGHSLLKNLQDNDRVYYVHSYYASHIEQSTLVASSDYGVDVPGIVMNNHVIGFQFHPEKSGQVGEQLLRNLKEVCL